MKFHVRENRKSSPLYVESPRGRLTEHPGGSLLIESHGSASLSLSLSFSGCCEHSWSVHAAPFGITQRRRLRAFVRSSREIPRNAIGRNSFRARCYFSLAGKKTRSPSSRPAAGNFRTLCTLPPLPLSLFYSRLGAITPDHISIR